MEKLLTAALIFHIIGGTFSLVSGLAAIIAKKGGRTHRLGGKVFFGAMTLVFITALVMAIIKELTFLLMVAFFSYYMLLRGYRALYLKRMHLGLKMAWPDILINGAGLFFNTGLLIWGVSHLVSKGNHIHIVAVFFGLLGIWMAGSDIKLFFIPPKDKKQWLYTHIGGMCGAYIAAVTAFLVVNVRFLPGLVVWTAPALTGLLLISLTIRRYKRNEERRPATSSQQEITYI